MNHVSYENWSRYVNDELEEKVRKQYEDHLYTCDQCLVVYSEAVKAADIPIPLSTTSEMILDGLISENLELGNSTGKTSFFQKAGFHYFVAAAMTIILMSSGVFSQLINVVNEFESLDKKESSIVSGLMDKSFSIIDRVEIGSKEEN
ncbi:hypothetical protein [Virgibacillus sp. DJP39]|uniref:hypothetical protein n=1 Tax=Virgibacillus sp. DJP39 TaxID=3409790 RepID=UPI003BB48944